MKHFSRYICVGCLVASNVFQISHKTKLLVQLPYMFSVALSRERHMYFLMLKCLNVFITRRHVKCSKQGRAPRNLSQLMFERHLFELLSFNFYQHYYLGLSDLLGSASTPPLGDQ